MTVNDPEAGRGLYRKYELFRVSETDPDHHFQIFDPFFVLRYATDPHARVAAKAYAESCRSEYPQLAADLLDELSKLDDPEVEKFLSDEAHIDRLGKRMGWS